MPKILVAATAALSHRMQSRCPSRQLPPEREGVDAGHINMQVLPRRALGRPRFLWGRGEWVGSVNRRARRVPYFEAVAVDGQGVFETLNTVSRMVLVKGFAQQQEGAPR